MVTLTNRILRYMKYCTEVTVVLRTVTTAVIIIASVYDFIFLQNCLVIPQAANILGFILFKGHLKEELTRTSLCRTAFKVEQSKEDCVVFN